ncbi:hypothetical protein BROUX41_001898 [Berkeleyomyces rouxiae]|uniref:uncharacterized protein n=1 Tax=Berkeleyomyces rouxiae TaxID=2035830 RepID=UPI003B81C9D4
MDEKQRAEKLAAARKKAQQMKKAKKEKKDKAEKPGDHDKETPDSAVAEAPKDEKPKDTPESEAAKDTAAAPESPTNEAPDKQPASTPDAASTTAASEPSPPVEVEAAVATVTAAEIYRKQAARIEELEKENKRLSKDSADADKRWKKAEEELEDLREAEDCKKEGAVDADEAEKLKADNESLERQIKQLQSQLARRHSSSAASPVAGGLSPAVLQEQINSKTAVIESMEAELSTLRAKLERVESGTSSEKEQISALEEKLERAEKRAALAQDELAELKKSADRTAEKALRDDSERTSIETKLRALEAELADKQAALAEADKKIDVLEKKVAALTTLHKEQGSREEDVRKKQELVDKQLLELKLKGDEHEQRRRLHQSGSSSRKSADGGLDDEGVDELEDEARQRLERQVRDLEAEVSELRRGIWRDRRKSLASGGDGGSGATAFHDVDLNSAPPTHSRKPTQTGGFGEFLASGLNALAGGGGGGEEAGGAADEDDSFLSDEDEAALDFDEDAFRRAQAEEAKARLERIKELKRGLKNWEGWRLDLVDTRKGVQGFGDVFEV